MNPVIRPVGDTAVLVDFTDAPDAFARVVTLDRTLAADPPPGMIETVPAATTLLLVYDPAGTDPETLADRLRVLSGHDDDPVISGTEHRIPLTYDGADIAAVAAQTGLAPAQVAARHAAATYDVVHYGFAPGYAYLGGVPAALRLPRKPAAVRGVAVGSVMIAGSQCLITTLAMPTGWWVIGHTDIRILDPAAARPFRFDPGDRVRFVPV